MHGGNRSTYRHIKLTVLRNNHILVRKTERFPELFSESRKKSQRATQKSDLSADRPSAGKPGNCLVYHRLENGACNIFMRSTLVQKRLYICFGKDAAP